MKSGKNLYICESSNSNSTDLVNPESSWLQKFVRYDSYGIKRLFEQYYTPLVLFAGGYVRDQEVAKDLVQDVFHLLIERQERFGAIENLKVYLYRAVKNRCLKYIRHEAVKGRYEDYLLLFQQEEAVYQERILEEEVFQLLNRAIQELPEQCRNVFVLTLQGKSNAEIAVLLGIGVETVKSHKKAGKKLLYRKLKGRLPLVVLVSLWALLGR